MFIGAEVVLLLVPSSSVLVVPLYHHLPRSAGSHSIVMHLYVLLFLCLLFFFHYYRRHYADHHAACPPHFVSRSRGYDQIYRSLGSTLKEWLNNVNETHMHIHYTLAEEHQHNRAPLRDGVADIKLPSFPEIFCRDDDDSIDSCGKNKHDHSHDKSSGGSIAATTTAADSAACNPRRSCSSHDYSDSKQPRCGCWYTKGRGCKEDGKEEEKNSTMTTVTSSFILMYRSSRGTNLASFLLGLVREAAVVYFCSEIVAFEKLGTQGQDGAAYTSWRVKVRQLPPSPAMSPPPGIVLQGFPPFINSTQLQEEPLLQGQEPSLFPQPHAAGSHCTKKCQHHFAEERQQEGCASAPSSSPSCPFAHAFVHQEQQAQEQPPGYYSSSITSGSKNDGSGRTLGAGRGTTSSSHPATSTTTCSDGPPTCLCSAANKKGEQDTTTAAIRSGDEDAALSCAGGRQNFPPTGVGLTEAQLMTAFPFHIVLDRDIQIKQLGSGYRKLNRCAPALHLLSSMRSSTMITTPSIVSGFFDIVKPPTCTWSVKDLRDWKDSEFILETKGTDTFDTPFRLTGSLLLGEDGDGSSSGGSGAASFIFLVQPDINNLDDMCNLDLTWSDFPKHSAQKKVVYMSEHLKSETYLSRKSRIEANNTQQLLEMKRMFVRYVSHEIRTPLNTVAMGLRLIHKIMQDEQEEKNRGDDAKKSLPPPLAALDEAEGVIDDGVPVAGEGRQERPLETPAADSDGRGLPTNKPTSPAENENPVEMVGEIMESCDIAVNILNDLLLFEKIDGGMLEVQTKEEPALLMVYEVITCL